MRAARVCLIVPALTLLCGLNVVASPQGLAPAAAEQAANAPGGRVPVVRSAEDLRELAKEILSGKQYQREMRGEEGVGPLARLWARLLRWLAETLRRPFLEGLQRERPWMYWTVVGLLVAVLLLILSHFALTLRSALRGEDPVAHEGDTLEAGSIPRARELLGRAEGAAAAGQYREAIRLLYLALLARLDELGVIAYDQTKTNWEYLGATRSVSGLHQPFSELTAIFDRKWYGSEPAAVGDYSFCRRLWDKVALLPTQGGLEHGAQAAGGSAR